MLMLLQQQQQTIQQHLSEDHLSSVTLRCIRDLKTSLHVWHDELQAHHHGHRFINLELD